MVALVHVLIFLSFGAFESVCPSRDESVDSSARSLIKKFGAPFLAAPLFATFSRDMHDLVDDLITVVWRLRR